MAAEGQVESARQLAGDGDHHRQHPVCELLRALRPRCISQREPCLDPASAPLQTHEALWPRRRGASGLRRSGCSWSRSTSRARCTSPWGRACEQAQARASATLVAEKRGWYSGAGHRARNDGHGAQAVSSPKAPPSVGSSARRPFQRTRHFFGYLSLPATRPPCGGPMLLRRRPPDR